MINLLLRSSRLCSSGSLSGEAREHRASSSGAANHLLSSLKRLLAGLDGSAPHKGPEDQHEGAHDEGEHYKQPRRDGVEAEEHGRPAAERAEAPREAEPPEPGRVEAV